MSAADTANVAASAKNGRLNDTAISSAPSGGPMNVLATSSALHIRPFAFSRCSVWTIEGMNVWAELSYSTSAIPISSVARMMTP